MSPDLETSIAKLCRPQRPRLVRVVRKPSEREHARRALEILQLAEGVTVTGVAERQCAARSTMQRWREAFVAYGEEGVKSRPRGRVVSTVTDVVVKLVQFIWRFEFGRSQRKAPLNNSPRPVSCSISPTASA